MKLKEKIRETLRKVDAKGRERITVMFVPHSQKKIRSFHISYYAIFAAVGIVFVVSFFSFSLLTGKSMKENERAFLSRRIDESKYQLSVMREKVKEFVSQTRYRDDLKRLFVSAGYIRPGDSILAIGGGEEDVPFSVSATNETSGAELIEMESVVNELSLSRRYLDKLQQFLKSRKSFVDCIPNLWPLTPGNGVIVKRYTDRDPYADRGLYLGVIAGTPVRAAAGGTVIEVGPDGDDGTRVVVMHPYGFKTLYRGLGRVDVKSSRQVAKGEVIGLAGAGRPFLYQLMVASTLVDPETFISGNY
ncbi:MAG: M23 family metallopeptidase [Spirochaetota bacterium]